MGTKKAVKTNTNEVVRVCKDCGNSGIIDKDVQRVCRITNNKKVMIWRCKPECKK